MSRLSFAVMNFDRISEAHVEQRAAAGNTLALTILVSFRTKPPSRGAATETRPGRRSGEIANPHRPTLHATSQVQTGRFRLK